MNLRRLYARTVFWPTLGWNVLLGRVLRVRHWWDAVDEQVLIGALPFARDVPKLAAAGVRAVVNMCEEYPGPTEAYSQHGITQLWLPTIDFTPPSLADIERGVAFLDEQTRQGKAYVHCKAGRGRSATVVLCWLVACRGLSPEEAQARLLERRPHVHRRLLERVVVREFVAGRLSS